MPDFLKAGHITFLPRMRFHAVPQFADYFFIVLGMVIYSFGFTAFVLPHAIVVGGMAGFSTLAFFATGGLLPVAFTMYATNLLMLVCWYRTLGKGFVMRTVFGATILSVVIGLLEGYFISHPPIVTDVTMSVLMGSALMGLGVGTYYSHKGSAGGTDILAAVCEKRYQIDMGRTMMIVDVTIVACSFFLPFDGDMEARIQARVQTIIYGWLSIVVYSLIANYMVNSSKRTIQFLILSPKGDEIGQTIMHEIGRGVTTFDGTGLWTGEKRTMLVVWCRQYDTERVYDIVRRIDGHAYIIQSLARSVYGNGFDTLRHTTRSK